jgi:hypothetical protein
MRKLTEMQNFVPNGLQKQVKEQIGKISTLYKIISSSDMFCRKRGCIFAENYKFQDR